LRLGGQRHASVVPDAGGRDVGVGETVDVVGVHQGSLRSLFVHGGAIGGEVGHLYGSHALVTAVLAVSTTGTVTLWKKESGLY